MCKFDLENFRNFSASEKFSNVNVVVLFLPLCTQTPKTPKSFRSRECQPNLGAYHTELL